MKKRFIVVPVVALALAAIATLSWLAFRKLMRVESVEIDPNCTIYLGGGGNSIVLTSSDGSEALVVDTKYFSGASFLRQKVNARGITVVNTHHHIDHIQGNARYPEAQVISAAVAEELRDEKADDSRCPDRRIAVGEEVVVSVGNERVHVLNTGSGHSAADCVVYFERRKLLAAGDLVFAGWHPPFTDPASSAYSWMRTLERLQNMYAVEVVVPGEGRITDKEGISTPKDYFVSISNAIGDQSLLEPIRTKYSRYSSIPFVSGFDKTVKTLKKDMSKNR